MKALRYLFSFKGRINRAKIWLFLAICFLWTIAMMIVALIGLDWDAFFKSMLVAYDEKLDLLDPAKLVWPSVHTAGEWLTIGILALMTALITWVELAIYVKRLHDRGKSGWWLIPYWLLPGAAGFYGALTAMPMFSQFMTLPGAIANGVGSLISLWVFVELFILSGTKGSNRFGINPLAKGPVFCETGNPVYGCTPAS